MYINEKQLILNKYINEVNTKFQFYSKSVEHLPYVYISFSCAWAFSEQEKIEYR